MRNNDWKKLAMAAGAAEPAWPLPTVSPKFSVDSIGGGRPWACAEGKCERWHAGVDLTDAPDGALIVSPEDATVIGIDRGWSEGSKAAFLMTDSGLFLVLGGFKQKSHNEFGIVEGAKVKRGDKLGRILGSYGMIHLETYNGLRKGNAVWWVTDPPPAGLLNPTNYVERMAGKVATLVSPRQRHEALKQLGYFKGDVDAAWGPNSEAALKLAQAALGVTADGKWGPNTETVIRAALTKAVADANPSPSAGEGTGSDLEESGGPLVPRPSWKRVAVVAVSVSAVVGVSILIWRTT